MVSSRAVVSPDMSRSRDTIFQSLGREGLKPRSRLGKWARLGRISNPSVKTHHDFKFLTEKKKKNFLF